MTQSPRSGPIAPYIRSKDTANGLSAHPSSPISLPLSTLTPRNNGSAFITRPVKSNILSTRTVYGLAYPPLHLYQRSPKQRLRLPRPARLCRTPRQLIHRMNYPRILGPKHASSITRARRNNASTSTARFSRIEYMAISCEHRLSRP